MVPPDNGANEGSPAYFPNQILSSACRQNLVKELMTYAIGATLTVNNYFGVLQAAIHNLDRRVTRLCHECI